MNCPKCGKELELQNKQVGVGENGNPILNEYAICRDCKKQWNLDKQKAKKAVPAKEATPVKAAPVKEAVSETVPAKKKTAAPKKSVESEGTNAAPKKRPAASEGRPAPKKRPVTEGVSKTVSNGTDKPVSAESKQTYGNIPPEKVRVKRERAVRQNYEDMLAADPNRKPQAKKKRPVSVPEESDNKQAVSAPRKKPVSQPQKEMPVEEEAIPRFQIMRIIFGVVSLVLFAFFAYKGFMAGLSNISSGKTTMAGTVYIVMALCMLVSGLLLFILRNKDTILTFILPMIFYIGSAVFAFIKRSDDSFLLIGAAIGAVLGVIFLILTFASRGSHDEEDIDDDYDDPFDEDHDNY